MAALVACAAGCGHTPPRPVAEAALVAAPAHATSLVELTAAATAELVRAETPGDLALRVRITAPPIADANRPPLDLALVLDTSASMEGAALDHLRDAAHRVVAEMSDRDRLSIVAFSSTAQVVLSATALDPTGRDAASRAIDGLRATGTTDLAGGLALGIQELLGPVDGTIDRVVLVADGFPNDPAPIPRTIQMAAAAGLPITTIGIGIEASDQMLDQIARTTGGVYRYAPDGAQIAQLFHTELARIQTLVATDLTLDIVPGPGVEIGAARWLAGAGRQRRVSLGDLAAGETREVYVPVSFPGHKPDLTVELADLQLTFRTPSAAAETRTAFVAVRSSTDPDAIARSVRVDLARGQARAEAAGAIIEAINRARAGQLEPAQAVLTEAERVARARAADLDDDELVAIADRIVELARNLRKITPPPIALPASDNPTPQADLPASDDTMLLVEPPGTAPAAVEPAIREIYEEATRTVDGRSN